MRGPGPIRLLGWSAMGQGRVLGLDFGTRRIGLAVSDPEGRLAFPAGCLMCREREKDLRDLCALVEERDIARIVVGWPLHLDGRVGPEAEAARAFADDVAKVTGRPVEMLDERWTTREAQRALRDAKRPRRMKRRTGEVDSVAATILLRTYLETEARKGSPS